MSNNKPYVPQYTLENDWEGISRVFREVHQSLPKSKVEPAKTKPPVAQYTGHIELDRYGYDMFR